MGCGMQFGATLVRFLSVFGPRPYRVLWLAGSQLGLLSSWSDGVKPFWANSRNQQPL
jgi:hypothetical protein